MNALTRLSEIINANVNAMMDRAEDPEAMVRHAVRSMRDTLVDIRATSARYIAEKKRLEERMAGAQKSASDWQEKAARAVSHGRDDLAKQAIREAQQCERAHTAIEAEYRHIEDAIAKMRSDREVLEGRLEEAKARQKGLILRGKTARSRLKVKQQIHDVDMAPALARFEAYERRLDEYEGEIEAYDLNTTSSLADEISRLDSDEGVNRELAALKARIQHSNNTLAPPAPVPA